MKNVINGIYLITERATGKMYVGLAKRRDGIEGRWRDHKERFPKALFTYEILLPCPPETTREELSNLEKFYIKELDCMEPNGFNRTSGGCGKTEVSEETRKRVSAALKGIPMSEEQKAKRRGKTPANKGKPGRALTAEQKAKQSAALKGRVAPNKGKPMSEEQKAKRRGKVQSEETRAKNSAANKGRVPPNKGVPMSEEEKAKRRGKTPANKGKPGRALTAEQRAKQSAALKGRVAPNKGKPISEEQRAKCSATMKGRVGRVQSEEEKAKRSATQKGKAPPNKGKPMSEEQKKKLSEAVKARLALKRAAKAAAEIEAPEELLDSSSFNNLDTSVIT